MGEGGPVGQEWLDQALAGAEESFIASSGPGGQNVNKVATAVQLRLDVFALRLQPQVFRRLKGLAGNRMNARGEIVLTARSHRTQDANRTEARERMGQLLRQAHVQPRQRRKSRLNRINKEKRIRGKKNRGAIKASRGKVDY
ncbi:aminoacyl-tRNA hydrolase [Altererythrobacter sp. SALINAS58]|uniref:alternative ribosome rescue aminoacyl-tRNA hydrolase ArfB n=1 Tax=Alteripontixanthobacter muriae TaxID=2705546 RepID=UPI001575B20F|nr:alternative ribosome rescue aminoacyl-tRNA hydrolase ArfB [Alteripontixanthobacter muriae]NTZ43880.1 aminoacyl-tRNA hydrolase [Alteripontixanthobacter muriae]